MGAATCVVEVGGITNRAAAELLGWSQEPPRSTWKWVAVRPFGTGGRSRRINGRRLPRSTCR